MVRQTSRTAYLHDIAAKTCDYCKEKFYRRPPGPLESIPKPKSNPDLEVCSEDCAMEVDYLNYSGD